MASKQALGYFETSLQLLLIGLWGTLRLSQIICSRDRPYENGAENDFILGPKPKRNRKSAVVFGRKRNINYLK